MLELLPGPDAAAPELPEQVSSLQLVLLELELLLPLAAPDPLELSPPEVLDVLLVSPSLAQPLEEAAPPMTLFSASASHSASPPLPLPPLEVEEGVEAEEVAVEEGEARDDMELEAGGES